MRTFAAPEGPLVILNGFSDLVHSAASLIGLGSGIRSDIDFTTKAISGAVEALASRGFPGELLSSVAYMVQPKGFFGQAALFVASAMNLSRGARIIGAAEPDGGGARAPVELSNDKANFESFGEARLRSVTIRSQWEDGSPDEVEMHGKISVREGLIAHPVVAGLGEDGVRVIIGHEIGHWILRRSGLWSALAEFSASHAKELGLSDEQARGLPECVDELYADVVGSMAGKAPQREAARVVDLWRSKPHYDGVSEYLEDLPLREALSDWACRGEFDASRGAPEALQACFWTAHAAVFSKAPVAGRLIRSRMAPELARALALAADPAPSVGAAPKA